MVHVWQSGHGIYPVNAAVDLFLQTVGDYVKAYPYNLTRGSNLSDFNIEQQASIVADYWALLTQKLAPQDNKNPKATLAGYSVVIDQLQKSGPSVRKLDQVPLVSAAGNGSSTKGPFSYPRKVRYASAWTIICRTR
jgi:hypothetical protein